MRRKAAPIGHQLKCKHFVDGQPGHPWSSKRTSSSRSPGDAEPRHVGSRSPLEKSSQGGSKLPREGRTGQLEATTNRATTTGQQQQGNNKQQGNNRAPTGQQQGTNRATTGQQQGNNRATTGQQQGNNTRKFGQNTKTLKLAKCGQHFETLILAKCGLAKCGHENKLAKFGFFWPNAVWPKAGMTFSSAGAFKCARLEFSGCRVKPRRPRSLQKQYPNSTRRHPERDKKSEKNGRDQVWPNPSLAKFGYQVWPRPSLARPSAGQSI